MAIGSILILAMAHCRYFDLKNRPSLWQLVKMNWPWSPSVTYRPKRPCPPRVLVPNSGTNFGQFQKNSYFWSHLKNSPNSGRIFWSNFSLILVYGQNAGASQVYHRRRATTPPGVHQGGWIFKCARQYFWVGRATNIHFH